MQKSIFSTVAGQNLLNSLGITPKIEEEPTTTHEESPALKTNDPIDLPTEEIKPIPHKDAIISPHQEIPEEIKRYIEHIQKPRCCFLGWHYLHCIEKYIQDTGCTAEQLGIFEFTELKAVIYENEAKKWLEYARNTSSGDRSSSIDHVREYTQKAGCTLEYIGTSEKELAKLRIRGYESEAKKWLGHARNTSSGDRDSCIGYIQKYTQKAGCTLEYIGTSEKELAKLKIEGYESESKKWLGYARNTSFSYRSSNINRIRKYTQKAGCTLEYIGTSEEELTKLLKQ